MEHSPDSNTVFAPSAAFVQTCGSCGSTFRVEIERQRFNGDQQEYACPHCRHHVCRVATSTPPRITLLSTRSHKRLQST
ncbi:MAG TPA: hypothetical protein VMH34_04360 [Gammaproteobacteria bacterium]|nr:hypothetical protein [Gammaproteobacteria bacterium]